jgi:hypothetical protein
MWKKHLNILVINDCASKKIPILVADSSLTGNHEIPIT